MKRDADTVALVLAAALVLAVVGISITLIVNVVSHQNPTATIGENSTQILVALVGGLIGVLGSYLGHRGNDTGER
jgi:hypothetical protein